MLFTTGINDERIVDISTLLEYSATERGSVRGVLVLLGRPMSEDIKMLLLERCTGTQQIMLVLKRFMALDTLVISKFTLNGCYLDGIG